MTRVHYNICYIHYVYSAKALPSIYSVKASDSDETFLNLVPSSKCKRKNYNVHVILKVITYVGQKSKATDKVSYPISNLCYEVLT